MFCAVLAFSEARISEVLAFEPNRIDKVAGVIVFETLKKRKRGISSVRIGHIQHSQSVVDTELQPLHPNQIFFGQAVRLDPSHPTDVGTSFEFLSIAKQLYRGVFC